MEGILLLCKVHVHCIWTPAFSPVYTVYAFSPVYTVHAFSPVYTVYVYGHQDSVLTHMYRVPAHEAKWRGRGCFSTVGHCWCPHVCSDHNLVLRHSKLAGSHQDYKVTKSVSLLGVLCKAAMFVLICDVHCALVKLVKCIHLGCQLWWPL